MAKVSWCRSLLSLSMKHSWLTTYRVAQKISTDFQTYFIVRIRKKNICNNAVTKVPTKPQVCRYTTLWKVSVLKATIENKTTSVTTHFKSASSSNKTDRLNIWCKNCMMRQLLSIITETINTLFPVVNFSKCVVIQLSLWLFRAPVDLQKCRQPLGAQPEYLDDERVAIRHGDCGQKKHDG